MDEAATAGTVKSDPTASETETDFCAMSPATTTAQCHDVRVVTCHNDVNELLSRPILVGYAFGPKKMSTMGVVMAEASKTHLSSVSTTVLVEEEEEEDDDLDNDEHQQQHERNRQQQQQQEIASSKVIACTTTSTNTTASPGETIETLTAAKTATTTPRPSPRRKSIDSGNSSGKVVLSLDSYNGGLKNIVRYLHSSCSSVDTNSTTTTFGTTITGGGVTPSSASTCGGGGKLGGGGASIRSYTSGGEPQQRLRVSFVPLDPDFSLEGQHGAKMDIILHKLTEDILCLSKYAPVYPDLVPSLGESDGQLESKLKELHMQLPQDAQAAIMRVHRLMRYQKKYPECSLADDPAKVLTLMSRSDIANALANCLVGVKSASGIPVASPRFLVWDQKQMDRKEGIANCIRDAGISYPLIAKPLQAAGTKISHQMTVLLHESSLEHIQNSSCLLQEYANHDAVLYKVYVLGNNVRVYQRPSLPNLPPLAFIGELAGPSYVDFDSQRPYPRLSAFGVKEGNDDSRRPYLSSIARAPSSSGSPSLAVTAEEVQPVVDTLKQAFGLELFGFDILITSTNREAQEVNGDQIPSNKRKMLVVDVNYFPSYKEVPNFPSLLAQYLTQRAIDSRRRQEPPRSAAATTSTCPEKPHS